jgi:hypothetical protein
MVYCERVVAAFWQGVLELMGARIEGSHHVGYQVRCWRCMVRWWMRYLRAEGMKFIYSPVSVSWL